MRWHFSVYADYKNVVQILVNITKNANQFTDNGEALVKAWTKVKSDCRDFWYRYRIDEREIKEIWERFYKADVSRKSTKYGAALDFAIIACG